MIDNVAERALATTGFTRGAALVQLAPVAMKLIVVGRDYNSTVAFISTNYGQTPHSMTLEK
jgi:hypothetical protein